MQRLGSQLCSAADSHGSSLTDTPPLLDRGLLSRGLFSYFSLRKNRSLYIYMGGCSSGASTWVPQQTL